MLQDDLHTDICIWRGNMLKVKKRERANWQRSVSNHRGKQLSGITKWESNILSDLTVRNIGNVKSVPFYSPAEAEYASKFGIEKDPKMPS